ncbi:VOC family protein [Candidatus Parcubacteria bacterium]|nr:VOC family protein [Candidatus Parcubacteria bacterium]
MLKDANVTATIAVNNLEEAEKFYGQTLGLEEVKRNEGGITYRSGNSKLFVYPSQYAGTNKATYAAFVVPNVEEVASALKEKGVSFGHYPELPGITIEGDIHKMGDFIVVWIKDPSGNMLAISNED